MSADSNLIDSKQATEIIGCKFTTFKDYLKKRLIVPYKKVKGRNFFKKEVIKNFETIKIKKNNSLYSEKGLIDGKEGMKIIGCSRGSFQGYISKGMIESCCIVGRQRFFDKELIENFVMPTKSSTYKRQRTKKSFDVETIKKWQTTSCDTGSSDVEIGSHTEKILELEINMKSISTTDPSFSNMRKLLVKHVVERRRLLNYLQTTNFQRYKKALSLIKQSKEIS